MKEDHTMISDSDFFWGFVFPIILITALAVLALVFGVPWLWELLKPLLRAWVA